jgi:hypothetical protein
VLEAKQGANDGDAKPGHGVRGSEGWDQSMVRAKNQAERYVRALPAAEGRPPFLLVVDASASSPCSPKTSTCSPRRASAA